MRELEEVTVRTRQEWRRWLETHHTQRESIWLVTFKKSSGEAHLAYDDLVEEALCFGWIDGVVGKVDERRSKALLSPRKSRSAWSRTNKERVARLIEAGLMTPAGLAKIEEAKANGSWEFLDDVETLALPDDLRAALEATPGALANFEAFNRSSRRGILEWIKTAKRPETREKRVSETARLAAMNLKANFPESKGK